MIIAPSPIGVRSLPSGRLYTLRQTNMGEYHKDYDDWMIVKQRINDEERPSFAKAGDVRWASVGVNVGSEIDGKGKGSHTRPVLVLELVGKHLALVVPFSTKLHERPGYVRFDVDSKPMALCVHQVRVVSQKRLLKRIAHLADTRLKEAKVEVKKFWCL